MSTAGHRIEIDPSRELMHVTLWGNWANSDTDGLSVDHAKATHAMKVAGVEHGRFLTLVDMRDKRLDEQTTIIEFRKSFDAGSPSRRTAIVVSPDLPITMAEKIAPPGRVLIVYTLKEAYEWLFAAPAAVASHLLPSDRGW